MFATAAGGTRYGPWEEAAHVIVHVGWGGAQRRFLGHRTVLAEHSGYIKSLLAGGAPEICVPNVSPEVFSPLLGFMYTGYLELRPDNVYAVLLATHLLHMPRAVDACRAYLLRTCPPPLVKPVPRLCFPPPWLYRQTQQSLPTETAGGPPVPERSSPRASTSRTSPPPPPSPTPSDAAVSVPEPPTPPSERPKSKVVRDVACCDGPVRFKRVLNANYTAKEARPADKERQFVCRHCKHTFKSHYCYRKHAKRHLHPIQSATEKSPAPPSPKPLDKNVQYYPCKTCGSKFPSYYFVHKHRKLCHPEQTPSESSQAS